MVSARRAAAVPRPEDQQLSLLPKPTPLPSADPLTQDLSQLLLFQRLPIDPKPLDPPLLQEVVSRRKWEPPPQFHFGVVHITDRDKKRWQKNVRRFLKQQRHELEYGPPEEFHEWHRVLLCESLKALHDVRNDRETLIDVLRWILTPLVPAQQIRALSFQACCLEQGMNPEEELQQVIAWVRKPIITAGTAPQDSFQEICESLGWDTREKQELIYRRYLESLEIPLTGAELS
jgi:hypothetical protein